MKRREVQQRNKGKESEELRKYCSAYIKPHRHTGPDAGIPVKPTSCTVCIRKLAVVLASVTGTTHRGNRQRARVESWESGRGSECKKRDFRMITNRCKIKTNKTLEYSNTTEIQNTHTHSDSSNVIVVFTFL